MGREQECEPSSASPQIRWQPGPGGVAGEEDAGGKGNEGWSQGRKNGGTDVQCGRCRRWVTSEVSGVSGMGVGKERVGRLVRSRTDTEHKSLAHLRSPRFGVRPSPPRDKCASILSLCCSSNQDGVSVDSGYHLYAKGLQKCFFFP